MMEMAATVATNTLSRIVNGVYPQPLMDEYTL
jgi:hypothetical protein